MSPPAQDETVGPRSETGQKLLLRGHRERLGRGKKGDFKAQGRKLLDPNRRKARILKGGRPGIGAKIIEQRTTGFKAPDAPSQGPPAP